MVSVLSLWLPIVLSALLVFVVSSVIHMVLGYHRSDYVAVPEEERIAAAMRAAEIPPGQYVLPHASGMKEMGSPEFVEKMTRGPVAFLTVRKSGPPRLGPSLFGWFVFSIVVSVFAAYIAGRALTPGAEYLEVFRFTGTAAFLAYGVGHWPEVIWWGRKPTTAIKNTFDGFVYALVTAGAFGWLWPAM